MSTSQPKIDSTSGRDARDQFPTNSPTAMHSHKNHKLSLFKPNRSQASLLSAQEPRSYQASPIDSPLQSPAFPPPSAVSSLDSEDRDDRFGLPYDQDASRFYQGNGDIPRRAQSQRTPPGPRSYIGAQPLQPTVHLVGSPQGGAAATRINEDPDAYYYQQQHQAPVKPEQKKKRRFFGFGESTLRESVHNSTANPQRGIGRSISVRRTDIGSQISSNTENHPNQQRWPIGSTSAPYSPAGSEEEQGGGAITDSPYGQISEQLPPIPPKDPQKSQQHPPSPEQDQSYNQTDFETSTTASNQPHLGENQAPHRLSTLDRSSRPTNHPRNPSSDQSVQYQSYQSVPTSASSTSSHPLPLRGASDLAYPQPQFAQHSRPSSRQSYQPPSPAFEPTQFQQRTSSIQGVPVHTESSMAPTSTQAHPGSRAVESNQQNSQPAPSRDPPNYQAYTQNGQGSNQANGASTAQYGSQLSVNNQQGGSYRGTPQPSPMVPQGSSDQGRSTPPPSRSRDDLTGHDMASLLAKYDELNEKYRKVKKYYFDKDAQVQNLQNTLAHQRLAQSRNSLDDNEYTTRFLRLDGQINNLAFNIRKEWRAVPYWLAPHVNKDATSTTTKEMTAVGRACISRWLVEEILDRFFHPALEPSLSSQLKIIEKNLRRFAPHTPTDEDKETLMAKISNWRLSTMDGLQDMLASHDASEFRAALTEDLVKGLTQSLMVNLKEPPPLGLEAGVSGIVELAVGIAANIPLESREVFVEYIMPGTLLNESYMKVEGTLPPLTNPGEKVDDDSTSSDSAEEKGEADRDSAKDVPVPPTQQSQQQQQQQYQLQQPQGKKKGRFGGLMTSSKKPPQGLAPLGNPRGTDVSPPQAPKEERVRFAAFMAVEVRGRSTLVKAPIYM